MLKPTIFRCYIRVQGPLHSFHFVREGQHLIGVTRRYLCEERGCNVCVCSVCYYTDVLLITFLLVTPKPPFLYRKWCLGTFRALVDSFRRRNSKVALPVCAMKLFTFFILIQKRKKVVEAWSIAYYMVDRTDVMRNERFHRNHLAHSPNFASASQSLTLTDHTLPYRRAPSWKCQKINNICKAAE